MTEKVTVELPQELVRQVRAVAHRTQRSFDEVLAEWAGRAGREPVLELLGDEELLAECDRQMDASVHDALTDMLARNEEGALDAAERGRLDGLMRTYRAALVRKAQALQIAAARGLRQRLG